MTLPASRHRTLNSSCSTWPARRVIAHTEQQAAMLGVIRITEQHPRVADVATSALRAIPVGDLRPGAVLLFQPADLAVFGDVLRHWLGLAPAGPVKVALTSVLGEPGVARWAPRTHTPEVVESQARTCARTWRNGSTVSISGRRRMVTRLRTCHPMRRPEKSRHCARSSCCPRLASSGHVPVAVPTARAAVAAALGQPQAVAPGAALSERLRAPRGPQGGPRRRPTRCGPATRQVLQELGLDYDSLASNSDVADVARQIMVAACGPLPDGTIEEEEQRVVAAQVAQYVLEANADGGPPAPEEIVRETIAVIIFEAVSNETAAMLHDGERAGMGHGRGGAADARDRPGAGAARPAVTGRTDARRVLRSHCPRHRDDA